VELSATAGRDPDPARYLPPGSRWPTALELRRSNDAIARYLQAFEKQILPEDVCAARVQALREQRTKLQTRQAELKHQLAAAHATPPDPGLLDELKAQVRHVMTSGTASTRKALLKELVAEIRVEDRHTIRPWFWVPDGTRTTNRQVAPQNAVRNLPDQVDPAFQHANRPFTAQGPTTRL